ncbi:hypothetical protein F4780DRAFT_745069 [Xylariomycetidae sp. FL0641]|nr:hypothetical protein F4780DRAFT_745069 [Xylariomycetidae sp. FL0641]
MPSRYQAARHTKRKVLSSPNIVHSRSPADPFAPDPTNNMRPSMRMYSRVSGAPAVEGSHSTANLEHGIYANAGREHRRDRLMAKIFPNSGREPKKTNEEDGIPASSSWWAPIYPMPPRAEQPYTHPNTSQQQTAYWNAGFPVGAQQNRVIWADFQMQQQQYSAQWAQDHARHNYTYQSSMGYTNCPTPAMTLAPEPSYPQYPAQLPYLETQASRAPYQSTRERGRGTQAGYTTRGSHLQQYQLPVLHPEPTALDYASIPRDEARAANAQALDRSGWDLTGDGRGQVYRRA